MLRAIDASANTNRWRAQGGPLTLFCGLLMLCAMAAPPLTAGPLVWVAASAVAVAGARVPPPLFFGAMLVPLGFLLSSGAAMCVTLGVADGAPVLGLSAAGAWTALLAGLRAAGALAVTLCFACTVPPATWMALLRRARLPEPLLDLLMLVHRTLFLLDDTLRAILRAQDNRLGFRTARVAFRSTARAAASLFLRSLERAARLERGLAARGYTDGLIVLPPPMAASTGAYVIAVVVPAAVASLAFGAARVLGG
jgi:cobalt/nickel transport system permease protein